MEEAHPDLGRPIPLPAAVELGANMPSATVESLANETLIAIAKHLEEGDVWALSLVSRRLHTIAAPILWNDLRESKVRSEDVLLWCAERGRHGLMQTLLGWGVSPDCFFMSPILRSRLQPVLAAQGRRGAIVPLNDRTLQTEIFREKYCRSDFIRGHVRQVRLSGGVGLPMTDADLDWNVANGADCAYPSTLSHFGAAQLPGNLNECQYWRWTPLHIAILRHDNTAVRILLDRGADVDSKCSGACDCAVPDLMGDSDPDASVAPHENRSVWSALHVAMCSGNEEAVRLLLEREASVFVGRLAPRRLAGVQRNLRLHMTAFQDAAWRGSVQMCQILLGWPPFRTALDKGNRYHQTAVHYAAAAGHIQTVGKLLLENGAKFHYYQGETPRIGSARVTKLRNDPLRLLCMQDRYDDARWLLDFTRRLYLNRHFVPHDMYARLLAALAFLGPPTAYSQLSLRGQQDRLYGLTQDDINKDKRSVAGLEEAKRSEHDRLSLARQLLDYGVDPNRMERAYCGRPRSMPVVETWAMRGQMGKSTPLQLAARSGFADMVRLLLSRGADRTNTGDGIHHGNPPSPEDLPLMLAVEHAAEGGAGGLETVRLLLDAHGGLADIDAPAAMRCVLDRTVRAEACPPARWGPILELFLHNGAARHIAEAEWAEMADRACEPGNLRFCRRLAAARSFDTFGPETLAAMVRRAALGDGEDAEPVPEDGDLLVWVLRQCVRRGAVIVEMAAVEESAWMAREAGREGVADILWKFSEILSDDEAFLGRD